MNATTGGPTGPLARVTIRPRARNGARPTKQGGAKDGARRWCVSRHNRGARSRARRLACRSAGPCVFWTRAGRRDRGRCLLGIARRWCLSRPRIACRPFRVLSPPQDTGGAGDGILAARSSDPCGGRAIRPISIGARRVHSGTCSRGTEPLEQRWGRRRDERSRDSFPKQGLGVGHL